MFVRAFQCSSSRNVSNINVLDINSLGLHYTWIQKLKGDGGVLKKINGVMGNLHERVNTLLHEFDEANKSLYIGSPDIELCEDEATYLVAIIEALNEEHFLKQKAKIECLCVGDYNCAYFHKGATSSFMNIKLFSKCLSSERAEPMVCQVSNEERKDDMFSMGDNKSLGPHGFSTKGKSWKPCFNFAKGNCRFGDLCRYVHDANARKHNVLLAVLIRDSPTGTLQDPSFDTWNMDTGANSHLNNSTTSLSIMLNSCMYSTVSVGDGHSIPVTNIGHSILPTPLKSLRLNNVLITPHIVKNLIFVRQFVLDNDYTLEFDSFGFSVKDFMTPRVLLRCDSTEDLYPITAPSPIPHAFLVSQHTWHQHLGQPRSDVLRRLVSNNVISCNKEKPPILCHACQLGKHVRLPFVSSNIIVSSCFDIVHSDVWTSPIPSLLGFQYYVLFLDHYS
ncbi:ribonuclease H-like domain-containing protein [Tanacetum coccineum]